MYLKYNDQIEMTDFEETIKLFDDLGSMIDWMVEEGFWILPPKKQIIETEDPFPDATRPKLINHIEENNLEDQLRKVVGECWLELEGEIATKRKPRY